MGGHMFQGRLEWGEGGDVFQVLRLQLLQPPPPPHLPASATALYPTHPPTHPPLLACICYSPVPPPLTHLQLLLPCPHLPLLACICVLRVCGHVRHAVIQLLKQLQELLIVQRGLAQVVVGGWLVGWLLG